MGKKTKLKKNKLLLLAILLYACSSISYLSYARYTSTGEISDEIRVAASGNLNLVEKFNGNQEKNNLDGINIVDYEFTPGEDIDKDVYIEFTNSEVTTYLFLTIEVENWQYDKNLKEFSIQKENTKLVWFTINKDWNYLEDLSSEKKLIFYYEFDVNESKSTKIEIINEIKTGIFSHNDINLIDNQLKFSTSSIQKNNDLKIEESWDYLIGQY